MPDPLSIKHEPVERRQKNDFGGMKRLGNFHGDQVRIYAKGSSFAVEPKWRYDGDNLLLEEKLENLNIDSLNFSGILIVDSTKDSDRMRDYTVCVRGSKIHLSQTLHDLVCQPDCDIDGKLECCLINHSGSIKV